MCRSFVLSEASVLSSVSIRIFHLGFIEQTLLCHGCLFGKLFSKKNAKGKAVRVTMSNELSNKFSIIK